MCRSLQIKQYSCSFVNIQKVSDKKIPFFLNPIAIIVFLSHSQLLLKSKN